MNKQITKESFSWFKKGVASAVSENFVRPVIVNGEYDKVSPTQDEAITALHADGLVPVALSENWILMKMRMSEAYVTKKSLLQLLVNDAQAPAAADVADSTVADTPAE